MKITSKIIDAHMHLSADYQNLSEKKNALLLEMKRNGVSKGVVISDSELVSSIGNMQECVNLFRDCPDIVVVGGISPFINYDEQLSLLDNFAVHRKISGIKLYCGHEPVYLNDNVLEPVYILAEEHNLPVLFHSGWDNSQYSAPKIIKQAAEKHSNVRLICCHCCYPDLSECFDTLAECKNVYFDISSIADGEINCIKPVLEQAIRNTPDRFIFGSDYGCCSQEKHIALGSNLDISEYAKEMLLYKNAERIYFDA